VEKRNEITIFGEILDDAFQQMETCKKSAFRCALMADHHLGYSMPIGGVVAYEGLISPSGVGFDIACGNKAVLLDADADDVKKNISKIMDEVWKSISFGVGRKNSEQVDHELFEDDAWSIPVINNLKRKALEQLGTIGSGNHYVDIFCDDKNRIWIGVHFGSRGLGHSIATYYLNAAGGKDEMFAEPTLIEEKSDLGEQYILGMNLAGRYAYAGRDWVCQKVASIIGANIVEEIHNHHNFAWKETHFGKDLWVIRKGATPARPDQRGFVGGSMGDNSVILKGLDSEESKESLYSTIHGAGRVLGRRQASGSKKWKMNPTTKKKELMTISEGLISKKMMFDWITPLGIELRGAGTDEAPQCYKRLPDVLAAHKGTIEIEHVLTPLGVAMAGAEEFDPYKD
jgi:tRNA-splicing ligase RtcB (3'-phosphate/5'-hydroxy nucleic acid ligase)